MAKRTRTEFTVEGRGAFPYDMLRYDQCWPKYERETIALDRQTDLRTITLVTDAPTTPTHGRWESFGWRVTEENA